MNEMKIGDIFLRDVEWVFEGQIYLDVDDFARALAGAQDSITRDFSEVFWAGTEIKVRTFFSRTVLSVHATNSREISIADVLFQLHNAILPFALNNDHRYFEGLMLTAFDNAIPLFDVYLGS